MRRLLTLLTLLLGIALVGCHIPSSEPVSNTPLPQVEIEFITPTMIDPTLSPTIPPTPTLLADPVQLTAAFWESLPQVPVLMYHRFNPQAGASSDRYTTSLTDFERQLNALYDAGFSLISLTDWLNGNLQLQDGRRPLIITIDDLFYADQISLTEDGHPAPYSGVGVLWNFAQEHPDFNFSVALFYNLGDKGYANHYQHGTFTIQDGWRQARAEAIAWCLDNGAIPLNHFYEHPFLNQLSPPEILWQLEENDKALREALALAGGEHLIKSLPNILALPYVIWPETDEGDQVLVNYVNPEGAPVAAIIEGDYAGGAKFLQAPFSHKFDRWHVPRISASSAAIDTIIDQIDQIPAAANCPLGEFRSNPHILPEAISAAILELIIAGDCPYGYYVVNQFAFYVQENVIIQYAP